MKSQYNQYSLVYIPSNWLHVAEGNQPLYPEITFLFVLVYDKIDSKKLKVYIDNQEYYKTFLRTNGEYATN